MSILPKMKITFGEAAAENDSTFSVKLTFGNVIGAHEAVDLYNSAVSTIKCADGFNVGALCLAFVNFANKLYSAIKQAKANKLSAK